MKRSIIIIIIEVSYPPERWQPCSLQVSRQSTMVDVARLPLSEAFKFVSVPVSPNTSFLFLSVQGIRSVLLYTPASPSRPLLSLSSFRKPQLSHPYICFNVFLDLPEIFLFVISFLYFWDAASMPILLLSSPELFFRLPLSCCQGHCIYVPVASLFQSLFQAPKEVCLPWKITGSSVSLLLVFNSFG